MVPPHLTPSPGNLTSHSTWSTHIISKDCYSPDACKLLTEAGLTLSLHKKIGIDAETFGSLITCSGLILDSKYTWTCFHGLFDFGYLYKLVSGDQLPETEEEFL